MRNFIYYADKHASSLNRFARLSTASAAASMDGASFHVSPARLMQDDTEQADFVLGEIPDGWDIIVSLAVDQIPDSPPFKTLDVDGRAVPVLTDPDFVGWLMDAAGALHDYLDEAGALDRLYAIHFSPFGSTADDGEFHIPGDAAAWADAGVSHETAGAALLDYSQQLAAMFPGVALYASVLNPYNDFIGPLGQGDAGKSYLALEATLQQNPAYVTFDQTLKAPDERAIIRQAADGKRYGAMMATGLSADEAKATGALAESYGALFLIWQGDQVGSAVT